MSKQENYPVGLKICRQCQRELPYTQFYRNKNYESGFIARCKKCFNNPIKGKSPTRSKSRTLKGYHSSFLRLGCPSEQDYIKTYQLLEELGYDLKESIHLQFCEKHNFKPNQKIKEFKNRKSPESLGLV
jgi:hypothetical protein